MFNDRVIVGPQKSFSHTDLLEYVEMLLKDSKMHEERQQERSNYSWLRSRSTDAAPHIQELEELKPVLQKLTSERCSILAVQLDNVTANVTAPRNILSAFKDLLEDQYNAQMIEERTKGVKGTKNKNKRNRNKVHPELLPPGRQATVSFVLNEFY